MNNESNIIGIKLGGAELRLPMDAVLGAVANELRGRLGPEGRAHASSRAAPAIGSEWPAEDAIYAGLIRGVDGAPDYHLLVPRAPGLTRDAMTWTKAIEWAKRFADEGLALPDRRELRLAWINVPELFETDWYWSSEQYAGYPSYAWAQRFSDGYQGNVLHSYEFRCRLVRRLTIQ